MPLYDFECSKCGVVFEEIVAAGSDEVPACPQCGCGDTCKCMSCHCSIPGTGKDRLPGSLLRGRPSKMEQVPVVNKPATPSPCGGCAGGSCGGGSTS